MEMVVEYEYLAQEPDELNLKVGDVITDVVKIQEGWCEGMLNGMKGMFPDNFVKEVKKPEKSGDMLPKKNATGINELRTKLANVIINPPPYPIPKKVNKRAKVTFAYNPQNDDELTLEVGQIVEVLKQDEPGWWEVSLNGQTGMIPSNFVEAIEKEEPSSTPEIKGRKVTGVGFGPNIFESGQIMLKQTNPVSPARDKPIVGGQPAKIISGLKSPHDSERDVKPVLKAKVLFEYKAENSDELNLNAGDIILVLDQNLEDAGWWRGDLNGKTGVFPDNFVELLPLEEKPQKRPPPIDPRIGGPSATPLIKPKLGDDTRKVPKVPQNTEIGGPSRIDAPFLDSAKGLPQRPSIPVNLQSKEKEEKSILVPKPPFKEHRDLNNLPNVVSAKPGLVVTLEMFSNLQKEVNHLKEQLEKMKKDHEKTLLNLMSEIDDEKKNRYNIQVEMDRIKRLITSSSPS